MSLGHIGAGVVVLLLPGLALLAWLRKPDQPTDAANDLADAVGLSVALTALSGLVFNLLGVYPGALGAAFLYGICLATLLAAVLMRGIPRLSRRAWFSRLLTLLATALILGVFIAYRLYQARDLALPNWVDSVHHTLITRLILERGGLPGDMQPYFDAPLSYHYGFHILAASFAAWTRLPAEQVVLVFGQAVNALIALSIYRLARGLKLNRPAAVLAALLTGFVLQMPAYYLTWGRYTLSTGLVVLFPAMAAALDFRERPADWRRGLRLALLTAGVCLTQYLAVVILLLFLLVLGLADLVTAARLRSIRAGPWRMAGWSLAGGLAALPWLLRTLAANLTQATVRGIDTSVQASGWNYLITLIGPRYNHVLFAIAAVGLLFALRKRSLLLFNLWTLLMLFFSQPFAIKFGPFRPDLYVIVLFAPAAILLASLLEDGSAAIRRVARPWLGHAALALVAVLLLVWGVRETRNVINSGTVIVDHADRTALEWARANVPPGARFFVNTSTWQSTIYRGVDGGYWLMPFAGFYSLIPPVPYVWQSAEIVQQTNELAEKAREVKACNPAFWEIVTQASLTHVYVHDGKGSLQAPALDQCPRLNLLFREQGVSIYAIEGLQ